MLTRMFKCFLSAMIFFTLSCATYAADEHKSNPDLESFLTIADIHFDPFYSCHNVTPCPLITKLRHANVSDWSKIFASYDTEPSSYRQDTNYPLLTSALTAAKQVGDNEHAQFVIVLGDFLGHNYRHFYKKYSGDRTGEGYRSFVRKTFEYLNTEFAKTFPSIDVYFIVGNNDSYRGNYVTDLNGPFFKDLATLWSRLIKTKANRTEMKNEFQTAGYYAVNLPNHANMRLIVLNTNLFSYKARGKNLDKAANEQLDWLHNQLQLAKDNQQKVFIAMHIPLGIDIFRTLGIRLFTLVEFWQSPYSRRFQSELHEFTPEIAGIFTGHVHSDGFQILTFDPNKIPSTGTPSISPIYGNNPGFKLYIYSPQSQQLLDFTTYYFPLNSERGWRTEYDFNQIFQPDCHACPIIKGMELLRAQGSLASFYKYFYAVKTHSQPITTKWYPYYWCAIREVNASDYKKCIV